MIRLIETSIFALIAPTLYWVSGADVGRSEECPVILSRWEKIKLFLTGRV